MKTFLLFSLLVLAVIRIDDGRAASEQAKRQDLVPLDQMSRREGLGTLKTIADSRDRRSRFGPFDAEGLAAANPFFGFAGIYGGGSGDLGQQILSQHPQVAYTGNPSVPVHFAWVEFWDSDWCWGTHANYNAWNPATQLWTYWVGGCIVTPGDYLAVHATVALDDRGRPAMGYAETQKLFRQNAACSTIADVYQAFVIRGDTSGSCPLGMVDSLHPYGSARELWPKVTASNNIFAQYRSAASDTCLALHAASQDIDRGYLFYRRFDPCTDLWSSPVLIDSAPAPSHFLVTSPVGGRVVLAFCQPRDYASGHTIDNDLVYYESTDDGLSWVGGVAGPRHNVTGYAGTDVERAYGDAAGTFTSDGRLHLFWVSAYYDSAAGVTSDSRCWLRHWSESAAGTNAPLGLNRSNVVQVADWVPAGDPGAYNRNICNISVGVGDGSLLCPGGMGGGTNLDYIYLLYTQYGSRDSLDQADSSALGFQNGNLYLTVSPGGGQLWSLPSCLTTTDSIDGTPTRSPGCYWSGGPPNQCFSERLGTIAPRVGTVAHIVYDGDLNAGNTPIEQAGAPFGCFMYLRLSGDTVRVLCPEFVCWDSTSCGIPGDLTQDTVDDVFDVIASIDITFAGQPPISPPPGCPWDLSDVNCDAVTDVFDVIALIDYVFQGGQSLPNPCSCHSP